MLNKAILMGRLTADPELRKTSSDVSVTTFALAVDRNYGKGDDRQTDFINCVAWRNEAEFISRYFSKGRLMAVEGSIQTRKYTDKEGKNRIAVEVLVERAHFGGDSKASAASADFGPPPPDDPPPFQSSNKESSFASNPAPSAASPVAYSSGSADDFAEIEGEEDLPF